MHPFWICWIAVLVYGPLWDLRVGLYQASTSRNVPHPTLVISIVKDLMFAAIHLGVS